MIPSGIVPPKPIKGWSALPQAHLVGLQVPREVAASFNRLVASYVDGHHRLVPVLLTQLHHLRGPFCGEMPTRALSAAPCSRASQSPDHCHVSPQCKKSRVWSSDPNCQVRATWLLANCSAHSFRLCPYQRGCHHFCSSGSRQGLSKAVYVWHKGLGRAQ